MVDLFLRFVFFVIFIDKVYNKFNMINMIISTLTIKGLIPRVKHVGFLFLLFLWTHNSNSLTINPLLFKHIIKSEVNAEIFKGIVGGIIRL